MSDGGANISRGLGSGAAQVYDTSAPVNAYAKLMQQQQLKRAAEQKSLTDKLDKFDSKGVRIQDREGLNKVYEDWQKASIEALKATDRNEKFRLNAEAQNKLNIAEQFVYDSKAKTQRDLAVGAKILGKPYFFSEEGKKIFEKSLSAPIYSQDDIADYSTIPLGHDKSKVAKDIAAVNESLLKTAKYDVSQGVEKKAGDLTYAEFAKIKRVSPEDQIKGYELLYNVNDGFQALLEENYSDLDWDNNKEQALQTALTDFAAKYPLAKDEGVTRNVIPNKGMTEYQRRRLALAKAEAGGEAINENINVTAKTFTGTKLPQKSTVTGKPILDKNKKQVSKGKGVTADFVAYSTVNPPSFQMPQLTQAFNIDKAINEPINTEDAVNLTGIGYVKTKGGGTELKATIKVKGEEHIINPADLPVDIRTDKKYYLPVLRAVKEKFGEVSKQKTEKSAKSTTPAKSTSLKSKGGIPFTVE
jgi:hypothetical protein